MYGQTLRRFGQNIEAFSKKRRDVLKKDRGLFLKDGGLLEKKEDVFCGEGGEGVWYNFSVYVRVINNKVKVDSRAEIIGG